MGGTGGKIGLKEGKGPISLSLEGEILQFVSETLEHGPLHLPGDRFAPLIPKIGNNIEKTVFSDQFRTVPSTSRLSLSKIMGQVCYFITPPYQFWC